MTKDAIERLLNEWKDEFATSFITGDALMIALFEETGELVYANSIMKSLLGDSLSGSFLRPTFDELTLLPKENGLIFEGFITFGDYFSENTSILAKVFAKNNRLFVVGGVDIEQLMQQQKSMLSLNSEINNLQRQLIQERKNLQQTLENLSKVNNQLVDENSAKEKLFSVLAHDLRSPFNTILGFSREIAENIDELSGDMLKQMAGALYKTSEQTYDLLENLLLWISMQRNKIYYNPLKINALQLLLSATPVIHGMLKRKEIKLQISCPDDLEIYGDAEMLKTVIRNLVSNAAKYSNRGGEILLEASENDVSTCISVTDYGVGMTKEVSESLFKTTNIKSVPGTEDEKGTGLGLIICSDFIEKHKGHFSVESRLATNVENGKTTISFFIPCT